MTDATGASIATNTYDEYGQPGVSNTGRFQYTGQICVPEVELYHYKARAYSPTLGRFLQTDPIGYDGGLNLYAYVRNDPVNAVDPWGLQDTTVGSVTVNGKKKPDGSGLVALYAERSADFIGTPSGPPPSPNSKDQSSNSNENDPKEKKRCEGNQEDSALLGTIAGSLAKLGLDAPAHAPAVAAMLRGANISEEISSAGPEAVPVGLIVGIAVGLITYAYDRHTGGQVSSNVKAELGKCAQTSGG